jgi:hypothetical protein
LSIGPSDDTSEREANALANNLLRKENVASQASRTDRATGLQRQTVDGPGGGASAGGTGAAKLEIEFDAFIPGSLGKSFESYDHPKDLKNQASFEAALKAVPGTWLEEPGTFSALGTGPWCYATDNRTFGGGSHRVGFNGTVARSDIGSLAGKPPLFKHSTSGSEHVRWTHTGHFTSKNETGSLEGPVSKSAAVSSNEDRVDNSATETTVTTKGSAGYPFKALAPDIDYEVAFDLRQDPAGKTALRFTITNNKFPYYELLINGGSVWTYTSSDSGPSLTNLNESATFRSGFWYF